MNEGLGELRCRRHFLEFQFVEKLEKKHCYALEDFEGLFYKDFRNKNNDCYTLYHYHLNKGYIA